MYISSALGCLIGLSALASPALALPQPQDVYTTMDQPAAVDDVYTTMDQPGFDGSDGSDATFTLEQVEVLNETETNGLEARLLAYAKYNVPLPPGLEDAVRGGGHVSTRYRALVEGRQSAAKYGSVSAYPPDHLDIQYVVPVKIGNPAQTVFLNLDTGSGDFWTMSTETQKNQIRDHVIFDPKKSKTASLQRGQSWSITYGDGSSATGRVYKDRVNLGGTSFARQDVEVATSVSGAFTRDEFSSGILGLGFGRGNTVKPSQAKTYFENIMPNLAAPLFTANLRAGRPGNYNFGFIAKKEYVGNIFYTPLSRQNAYWEISVDGYRVGMGGRYVKTNQMKRVVVDTGTTLLLLPYTVVVAYYRNVRGARYEKSWDGYLFPCAAKLPDFYFGIRAYRGRVPGKYINYSQVNRTHCYGGLQSSEGIPFHLFGSVLLKAQFAVFDYVSKKGDKTPRVGFANRRL